MKTNDEIAISQERLKCLLQYDQITGFFTWRESKGTAKKGAVAGTVSGQGYVNIKLDGHLYKAHRLAWLWEYGAMPDGPLDHINGNRSDNKISNLRLATLSENQHNQGMRADNKSGIKGVSWDSKNKYWRAQIKTNGKLVHIGSFSDVDEARMAMEKARNKFHSVYASHGNRKATPKNIRTNP
ncbi:HNH endonuclease [Enterobacter chuandaensis]|uniref:HNH endonuclease n=1 Tax=Enterobacter chuandaensis TaxID=2497875 RepID=UPI003F41B8E7